MLMIVKFCVNRETSELTRKRRKIQPANIFVEVFVSYLCQSTVGFVLEREEGLWGSRSTIGSGSRRQERQWLQHQKLFFKNLNLNCLSVILSFFNGVKIFGLYPFCIDWSIREPKCHRKKKLQVLNIILGDCGYPGAWMGLVEGPEIIMVHFLRKKNQCLYYNLSIFSPK